MSYKEITSLQHPLVKHLVKVRTNKKYRYAKKTVVVEGKKLLLELRRPFKTVIVRKGEKMALRGENTYVVPKEVFEKISGVKSPEGVAAELLMPPNGDLSKKGFVLALDGINDPGNLGTLMRTALALGVEGLFLTPSCVDPYNEKALRAAKGATFKLPLQTGHFEPKGFHVYVAALKGTPLGCLSFETPTILLLGSEAQGVSEKMRKKGTLVTIPIKSQMESLNVAVAGAILMQAIRCQSLTSG